jgi:hypothetical protein
LLNKFGREIRRIVLEVVQDGPEADIDNGISLVHVLLLMMV